MRYTSLLDRSLREFSASFFSCLESSKASHIWHLKKAQAKNVDLLKWGPSLRTGSVRLLLGNGCPSCTMARSKTDFDGANVEMLLLVTILWALGPYQKKHCYDKSWVAECCRLSFNSDLYFLLRLCCGKWMAKRSAVAVSSSKAPPRHEAICRTWPMKGPVVKVNGFFLQLFNLNIVKKYEKH